MECALCSSISAGRKIMDVLPAPPAREPNLKIHDFPTQNKEFTPFFFKPFF
jgi:hypothetical protein